MKLPRLPALLVLSLLPVSGTALADDAAILKCRALGESRARLACYDSIPVAGQPAAALPATTAAPAAAPAASAEQRFGLQEPKRKEPEAPPSIDSTIDGNFDGWDPGAQIRLANGQVWRVVDGSSAALSPMKNPKVKVRRGLLGTMFLEIEGTNQSPKVRRIR